MIEHIELLEESTRRNNAQRLARTLESFYGWQRKFVAATKEFIACLLMAANQVGKTRTGTAIDAVHLTGDYPPDWEGHQFDFPPLCWLLGYSGEKTRDLLQKKLFGELDSTSGRFSGGLIPAERIAELSNGRHDYKAMSGTTGACREVKVIHKTGGKSICQFWSYSQGQHALMGDVVDFAHIDEEPEDTEIFPQVLTRLLNGDRGHGGRCILTLTPENGKTELVEGFMDEQKPGQYMQTATWDDAPHLSAAQKEAILAQYPAYQRDMRSRGVPLMGAGLIFPVSEDSIKIDPFPIPEYWFVLNAMDFGWDHPQAHIQIVEDRDNDIIYVTNAWKAPKKQPYQAWHVVKPWSEDIPTAWPHDGLKITQQLGKQDAVMQKDLYAAEGWWMLPDHATWPDGSNGVWFGITDLLDRMETGRLKIFSNLFDLFTEIREYHTKNTPSGNIEIVKVKDDLLDALRYAYMMRRFAIRICDIGVDSYEPFQEKPNPSHYDNF